MFRVYWNRAKEAHSLITKTHRLSAIISRVCPSDPSGDDRVMKCPLIDPVSMLLVNHLHSYMNWSSPSICSTEIIVRAQHKNHN